MATVYIAPTAQGSADGTSAANAYAYTSIATAETDATSGGTIVFVDGTYTLSTHLDLASAITYGVTYQPQTPNGVTISGSYGVRIGNTSMAGAIIFKDFILDIGDITQSADHGLRFINAVGGSITMNRCDCKIAIDKGSFDTAIGHNGGTTADGQRIDAHLNRCLFKIDNDATGTLDYGLAMIGAGAMDGSSIPKNFTITNCTFVALNGGKCSFLMYNQNGSRAYGTCVIKNTIVHSEGTASALVWGHSGGQLNMSFSNYYNPNGSWTIKGYDTGTAHTLADNINQDSQFVNFTGEDLRLRPSSPCINAGTAS